MDARIKNILIIGGSVIAGAVAGGVGVYFWQQRVWQTRMDAEMETWMETYSKSHQAQLNIRTAEEQEEALQKMAEEHKQQIQTLMDAYNKVFLESGVSIEQEPTVVEKQVANPKKSDTEFKRYHDLADRYNSLKEEKKEDGEMPRKPERREGKPYLITEDEHLEINQDVQTLYLEYYRDDLLVQADGTPLGGMTYDDLVGEDNLDYLRALGGEETIHVKHHEWDIVYEITYVDNDYLDSQERVADSLGFGPHSYNNDWDYDEDEW